MISETSHFLLNVLLIKFIEALTDIDNATGKMSGAKNRKKMKRHDDAGKKGKKKSLKAS